MRRSVRSPGLRIVPGSPFAAGRLPGLARGSPPLPGDSWPAAPRLQLRDSAGFAPASLIRAALFEWPGGYSAAQPRARQRRPSPLTAGRDPTLYSDARRIDAISSSVSTIGFVFMLLPRESATMAGIDGLGRCRRPRGAGRRERARQRSSSSTRAERASRRRAPRRCPTNTRADLRIAGQGRALRISRLQGRDVDPRRRRERRPAGHAVRNRELGAERRGQAVDGAQAGLGEADARAQGRVGHPPPGRRGRAARSRRLPAPRPASSYQAHQTVAHRRQTGEGQRVGERIRPHRHVRLEQLRQRIHAVARDQLRRAARQQVRIQDGDPRDERFVAERLLEAARRRAR